MPTLKEPQFTDLPPTVTQMKRAGVSQPEDRHVARPARDLPFLLDGDFLKVTNNDTRAWDFRWNRKHYVIESKAEGFVPFEALVDMLGDPRSMDNQLVKYNDGQGFKGIVMDRHAEITRLFARYAIENEDIDALVLAAPKVAVHTLAGQQIRFPSMNPDMLPLPTPMVDEHAVNTDTTKMIDQVAAENAELRDVVTRLEARLDREVAAREGTSTE
jgi:hypothetical protein